MPVAWQLKFTKEDNREAQCLARKAIALNPVNYMPKILLCWVLVNGARYGLVPDREAAMAEAEALVGEVLAKDNEIADAYALMGYLHVTRLNFDKAIAAGERVTHRRSQSRGR